MTNSDIAHLRLHNQRIAGTKFATPAEVVKWLGAVQGQDYPGVLWAVGLRVHNGTETSVEQALTDRSIVRTWPLRGTLHIVAAADVRWMLDLLAPRVVVSHARRLEQRFGLDEAALARCRDLLVAALQGGKQLSRDAIYRVLEAAHVVTANQRGIHILWHLAQQGLLCFGARQGKQHTFVLLDEWIPHATTVAREEALAELARRYFTSHGPAALADFAWWSGLTTADARAGLEMAKPHLAPEVFDGKTYWLSPSLSAAKDASPTAYLLPVYDEYLVAYRDRSAVLDPSYAKLAHAGNGIFRPAIVVDGQMVGTWNRTQVKRGLVLTPYPFVALSDADRQAFSLAADRYGAFRGLPVAPATERSISS